MPQLERDIESDLSRLGRDQSACKARLRQNHLPLGSIPKTYSGRGDLSEPQMDLRQPLPSELTVPITFKMRGQLSLTSLTLLFAPVHSSHQVLHCPQAFLHPTEHLPQPLSYIRTFQPPAASPGPLLKDVVGLLVLSREA